MSVAVSATASPEVRAGMLETLRRVTPTLLYELADLFRREEAAIVQPYAWPPRAPLTPEERREADRLRVTASRIAYRAACAEYDEAQAPARAETIGRAEEHRP